jgi:hypothetical protein
VQADGQIAVETWPEVEHELLEGRGASELRPANELCVVRLAGRPRRHRLVGGE